MAVMRLGYVHVRTPDLDAACRHYEDVIGLTQVASEDGKRYFKAWDEYDHHCLVMEQGAVGLLKLGYKVARPDELAGFEARLEAFGCTVERVAKGENLAVGEGVRFTTPSNHVIELYADIDVVGTATGTLNPDPSPSNLRGVGAARLDHAVITAEDPGLTERLFEQCLDFRAAERLVTDLDHSQLLSTWMFCGNSPHDIAISMGPDGKFHHFAFLVTDWSDLLRAGDVFGRTRTPVELGPTRHGISRGTTIYVRDPAGIRNEVFCGGYVTYPDFPTITWTVDEAAKGLVFFGGEVDSHFHTSVT